MHGRERSRLGERDRQGSADLARAPASQRGQPVGWFGIALLIGCLGIVLMILSFAATGFLASHALFPSGGPLVTASASASPAPPSAAVPARSPAR